MVETRRSCEGDEVIFAGDGYKTVYYFIHKAKSCVCPSICKGSPTKSGDHVGHAGCVVVSVCDISGCPPLHRFNIVDVTFCIGVPDWRSVFQNGSD